MSPNKGPRSSVGFTPNHIITIAHSLFCSCHGKGPSDGETGWLKTKARDLEAEDTRVHDSGSFHSILKACMEKILDRSKNKRGKHSFYLRVFYFVKRGAVLCRRKSELPEGTDGHVIKNHCFMLMGQNDKVRSRFSRHQQRHQFLKT